MSKIKFLVNNIHCMHCLHTIKMELSEIPGVKEVIGNIDKKEIEISYESPATPNEIEGKLIEINYPGELKKDS